MSVAGGKPRKKVPIEPKVHPTTNQRSAAKGRLDMAHTFAVLVARRQPYLRTGNE